MKIVIPDDYQDMVDQLECFSLIRHHDVTQRADNVAASSVRSLSPLGRGLG